MHNRKELRRLSDVVLESRKETQTNADTLHSLLVGIENFGGNVKSMQEEMIAWQSGYQDAEREYQDMNEELLQEVPLPAPAVRPEGSVNPPPVSIPPAMTSQFTVPSAEHVPQRHQLVLQWMRVYRPDGPKYRRSGNLILVRPPPANWVPEGFNVSKSAVQASQATIPQFFNFVGSSSGMPQFAVQTPASMERNTSFLISPIQLGFPPAIAGRIFPANEGSERYPKMPQPTIREKENSMQDEDQYSGTEISPGEAARIREEVQGVMKQQFAQACAHAEAISNLEKKLAAQESISKSVNATAEEDVIDLISKSAASLQKSPPSSIARFPYLSS